MSKGELDRWRFEIDRIDKELLDLLSKRKKISAQIMSWKKSHGKPLLDIQREEELTKRLGAKAAALGLDFSFIEALYELILKDSKES